MTSQLLIQSAGSLRKGTPPLLLGALVLLFYIIVPKGRREGEARGGLSNLNQLLRRSDNKPVPVFRGFKQKP